MRTLLISLAVTASALAVASPASAQWAPVPQQAPYGHGAPGYGVPGYGYGYNRGHVRALQVRVDRLQREISRLAQYRMISHREYRDLRRDSREIERRLRREARDGYGLNPREAYSIERRIVRLEHKLARDARDGRRWGYRWDGAHERDRDRWDRDGRWDRDDD